ncbi:MAG: glutamate-1-semialdehyde-2,1-aminomutase [Verrucomicrobia bacterium]|nr:MAG: glutamate-1-semialdehyde-2,1-aminomutase [Verrucomicrobiota bacterium]TAE88975.1 MAG: glutamate-1-semialdehyde-2,1-aminomutase [Verrucomicrobiota bacterium]TAF27407.1 MAG: glutamate-1-semialdehyde-2,1-aminomutase [Verrucomicrobiota bacterium]TAF42479.1 MAG: glutamate-1-semialdehyde-2,1-aminomutase [Verrucomicrobiota bacterium]
MPPVTGPLSQKLFAAAKERIPGGVNSPVRAFRNVGGEPFFVRRAKGSRIEDVDGKTYIDYIGSWGPNILGHAPAVITNTIHEVAKEGISFGIPNPYEVKMAQTICDWVPSVEKVRMTSSGTEATMSAIRLARGFTKRDFIVKFDGCYHGHSDSLLVAAGSGALTHGEPDSAGVPRAFAEKTLVLPYNDPAALEALFAARGEEIAAIIVESYPANAGLVFPRPGYLELLVSITRKYGALLIFDEVMTGFRLGKAGVQGLENLRPDLSCFGKVIGGGLPVGAFGGRADVMDLLAPIGPVYQAGTLSGNPLAMAAGLAQLKQLAGTDGTPNGYDRLEQLGAHFEAGLHEVLQTKAIPYRFKRVGSMFCLYFTDREIVNVDDVMKQDLGLFKRFFWGCLEKGIYLAPSPYETGFLSLAHTEADLDDTLSVFAEVLATI